MVAGKKILGTGKMRTRGGKPTVLECGSPSELLKTQFGFLKKDRSYPYRSLKKLKAQLASEGLAISESHLSNIFNGQRRLDPDSRLFTLLADIFRLQVVEQKHLKRLIAAQGAADLVGKSEKIKKLSKRKEFREAYWGENDENVRRVFSLLTDRVALPLIALLDTKLPQDNPKTIVKHFIASVTPREVSTALKRLEKLGFVSVDSKGRMKKRSVYLQMAGGREKSDELFRLFHHNSFKIALESLGKLNYRERRFGTLVYSIDGRHLSHLLDLIDEIRLLLQAVLERDGWLKNMVRIVRELRQAVEGEPDRAGDRVLEIINELKELAGSDNRDDSETAEHDMVVQVNLGGFPLARSHDSVTEPEQGAGRQRRPISEKGESA
jgi:uncharacterized protein (TIGR02147 family)